MIKVVYDQIELGNIKLPIFAQEKYLKCKNENYGWFISENYVLPFVIDKKLIFKRLIFTYEYIPLTSNLSIEDRNFFLNDIVKYLSENKVCDFISMAQSYVVFDTYPDKCDAVDWGSYYIELEKSDEELMSSFHAKHRNVIKRAIKDGVFIEKTDDYNAVFDNIKETLERQNSIFYPSLSYLKSLSFNIPDNTGFFVAKKDGLIQGSAIIIFDKNCGYYMYGGSITKPSSGSLNFLHYEVFKYLRDSGVKYYDFVGARINVKEGSKFEGIQKFKSRFGAELKQGYGFRVIFNPIKFKLFNMSVKLYGKIKGFSYSDKIDQIKSGKY